MILLAISPLKTLFAEESPTSDNLFNKRNAKLL